MNERRHSRDDDGDDGNWGRGGEGRQVGVFGAMCVNAKSWPRDKGVIIRSLRVRPTPHSPMPPPLPPLCLKPAQPHFFVKRKRAERWNGTRCGKKTKTHIAIRATETTSSGSNFARLTPTSPGA